MSNLPYSDLKDDDEIEGIVCRKCGKPITKKELVTSIQYMTLHYGLGDIGKCPPHQCDKGSLT